jgi:hypothetical protein
MIRLNQDYQDIVREMFLLSSHSTILVPEKYLLRSVCALAMILPVVFLLLHLGQRHVAVISVANDGNEKKSLAAKKFFEKSKKDLYLAYWITVLRKFSTGVLHPRKAMQQRFFGLVGHQFHTSFHPTRQDNARRFCAITSTKAALSLVRGLTASACASSLPHH